MKLKVCVGLFVALFVISQAFAQKVNVGYDKAADFTRFATYAWTEPDRPPSRPMLYAAVVGCVDYELKLKGLAKATAESDLLLVPAGGIDFGFNTAGGTPILPTLTGIPPAMDATMWTGAAGSSISLVTYVPEGTLRLTLVERTSNKIVWSGSVVLKLDIEKKQDSLQRIDKAITKLLKEYPPRRR